METIMRLFNLLATFILGLTFILTSQANARSFTEGWKQTGVTSYYHRSLNGNKTANGERYNHMGAMTAAHRSLPFGTQVRVTDNKTGKSIVVKINDRGPFHGNRMLDLSGRAATELGIVKQGVCSVSIEVVSMPKSTGRFDDTYEKRLLAKKVSRTKVDDFNSINLTQTRKVFEQSRVDVLEDLIGVGFDITKL